MPYVTYHLVEVTFSKLALDLWSCLEKEIMQASVPGARKQGRPRTAWMDNVKTWTELPVEESIRMTEDRDKSRKFVHGVANRGIEDG